MLATFGPASCRSLGAIAAKLVPPSTVSVGHWIRWKCQFGCSGYRSCLTCPPYAPWAMDIMEEMERMRREIGRFLGDFRPVSWTLPFSKTSFLPGRAARAYPLLNIGEDSVSWISFVSLS